MSKENVEKYLKELIMDADRSTLDSVINLLISVRDFKKASPKQTTEQRPKLFDKKKETPRETKAVSENVSHGTIGYENTVEYAALLIEGIDTNKKIVPKYSAPILQGKSELTEEQEDSLSYANALL